MNREPTELTEEEEIPQGVLDDLVEHFGEVILELDGEIDGNTISLKSNYFDKSAKLEMGTVMDAETFQPITSEGYHGKGYLVRVNESEDGGAIVKRVITMPIFETA